MSEPATQARRNPGLVTVLSGPTAVGKGTIVHRIRELYPDLFVSVSATTRPPRPGEIEGVHYTFLDDAAFDQLIAHDQLLEWAAVHGTTRYGTPREPVERAVAQGRRVLLELDLQGAREVRASMPEAFQVFLVPPSWEELVRRLKGRGTETPEQQERRLQTAREELLALDEFDAHIINVNVADTTTALADLMGLAPIG